LFSHIHNSYLYLKEVYSELYNLIKLKIIDIKYIPQFLIKLNRLFQLNNSKYLIIFTFFKLSVLLI